MRNTTIKVVLLAMLMTLSRYSSGSPAPQQSSSLDTMSAAELEKAGDEARSQKDYARAIQYFHAALRKDRKNAGLYNKLGLAELKNNDLSAARIDFERAYKRNSKYAEAVNNLGAVYYMKKSYGSAAKYFKKAVALEETNATYHVNLGAAWFSGKKMEQAVAEYARAMELDPDVFQHGTKVGVAAQIASPEERAQYSYLLAKIYAQKGDTERCLQCLRKAKEDGYHHMANVYKDEAFGKIRDNTQLHEIVPPPAPK